MELSCHKIKIESNADLSQKIKEFVNLLKIDYLNFKKEYEKEENEWKKFSNDDPENKNKDNTYFLPEKLIIKSPLTIIDAPWGTGKTFFIEQLAKMFIQDKLESPFFQKIVVFDAWKFCNYPSTVEEIVDQLVSIFFEDKDKKKAKKLFFDKMEIKLNFGISGDLGVVKANMDLQLKGTRNFAKQRDWSLSSKISNKLNNLPLTLIFFDNVERLGSFSWEVIKIVQKLSSINNLILIFPMNKNKLSVLNQDLKQNGEKHIEKYIQLPWYKLDQDYLNILKKLNINDKYINIINEILKESIDGHNLSIRQIEKSFRIKEMINKINNENIDKYKMLSILRDCWNPIIDEKYKIDTIIEWDIKSFFFFFEGLNNDYFQIKETIRNNDFLVKFYEQQNFIKFNNSDIWGNMGKKFVLLDKYFSNKNLTFFTKNNVLISNLKEIKNLLIEFKSNLEKFIKDKTLEITNKNNASTISVLHKTLRAADLLMKSWDDSLLEKVEKNIKELSLKMNNFWSIEENQVIHSIIKNKYEKDEDIDVKEMSEHISKNIIPWQKTKLKI